MLAGWPDISPPDTLAGSRELPAAPLAPHAGRLTLPGQSRLARVSLSIGIVGLPNVGKSTLFNALTRASALASNYPFATIEPNVGVVGVPDPRLAELAKLYDSARIVPATVRFTDIAGLVRGASQGQGLGNQFLAHIRETDAICQVVRVFADPDVTHVDGDVSPERDIETVVTELILADLQTLEKALPRLVKETKFAKDPERAQVAEAAASGPAAARPGHHAVRRRRGRPASTWLTCASCSC
jgi:ribosome-binding ATPase YchF (GTP1/OBG family)